MDRAPPALVALAKEASAVDTTRDGFDPDSCRAQAQTFQRFHEEMTSTLCKHANPGVAGALAFSASMRAVLRADTSVSLAALRSGEAASLARQQLIDAKQDAIAAMLHLGLLEVTQ